jgi:hypothetical protein
MNKHLCMHSIIGEDKNEERMVHRINYVKKLDEKDIQDMI